MGDFGGLSQGPWEQGAPQELGQGVLAHRTGWMGSLVGALPGSCMQVDKRHPNISLNLGASRPGPGGYGVGGERTDEQPAPLLHSRGVAEHLALD